jgi:hypothetical protein
VLLTGFFFSLVKHRTPLGIDESLIKALSILVEMEKSVAERTKKNKGITKSSNENDM